MGLGGGGRTILAHAHILGSRYQVLSGWFLLIVERDGAEGGVLITILGCYLLRMY